jgi:hypothetical protein
MLLFEKRSNATRVEIVTCNHISVDEHDWAALATVGIM